MSEGEKYIERRISPILPVGCVDPYSQAQIAQNLT